MRHPEGAPGLAATEELERPGIPLTVWLSKICRPRNWKMFAVPKVMMIACTRP